jgi:hypothetical protein
MKKHWLRGMLLGVSLALLLAGGAALAQGLITLDQECLPCWPFYFGEGGELPTEEYVLRITATGLDPAQLGCEQWTPPGLDPYLPGCSEGPVGEGPLVSYIAAGCDEQVQCIWRQSFEDGPDDCTDLIFGEWRVDGWQQPEGEPDPPAVMPYSFTFQIAEVCEEAVEFVPEPGTIALLGSGLAGLAGYAALRWRNRK